MSAEPKQTTVVSTKGTAGGFLLKAELLFPPTTNEEVYGCLKWDGPPKTLEEMEVGIDAELAERHARGRY